MTIKEAADRVGLAPSTLCARAKAAGIELGTIKTGKRGRPGLKWTLAAARAAAKGV